MNQQEHFELLKEKALRNFTDYTDAIKNASLDDLGAFNTRLSLLDTYTKAVASDIAYRDFIRKYYFNLNATHKK